MNRETKSAQLVIARFEVGTGAPGYRWVEGFKIIDPEGHEIQPYMRKREAVAYCKAQGWAIEYVSA